MRYGAGFNQRLENNSGNQFDFSDHNDTKAKRKISS